MLATVKEHTSRALLTGVQLHAAQFALVGLTPALQGMLRS